MPNYSDKKLLDTEPYRSIMNIFLQYGLDQKYNLIGIKHKHLLYVFKPSQKGLETNEMMTFFKHFSGKNLKDFSEVKENKLVVRKKKNGEDAIRDPGHLNKCLTLLRERDFIEEKGDANHYTYFLSETFFTKDIVRKIINELKLWDKDVFTDFTFDMIMEQKGFDNKPFRMVKRSHWNLFGINHKLFDFLSLEDKKILNNNMKNIVKNLEEISQMKLKYSNKEKIKASKNMDLKTHHRLYNISFHYVGTPHYNTEKGKKEYLKIKS
ncbi:MAG: hypothetical protein ACFFCM_21490 [Promethearchaeota archaeon]